MPEIKTNVDMDDADKYSNTSQPSYYHGAVNTLFDSLSDKDESVRRSIEYALGRMCEKCPNDTLDAICEYKQKSPKLADSQTAILLRVIDLYVTTNCGRIDDATLARIIDLCITEMMKSPNPLPFVQSPSLEILVSIGRLYCAKVMDALSAQLQPTQVAHFMIMNCMGTLATANINGIISLIKPTLETILPHLSIIKLDHVKLSYAFVIGRFAEAIVEHLTNASDVRNDDDSPLGENYRHDFSRAYAVLFQQWLPHRDTKFCSEVMLAVSHIYQLLPRENIVEQVAKVITQLQTFYRRSMDRNAITQLMASVLKASIDANPRSLDSLSDQLIIGLFDLVCVNPDYEKPQTVKGHNEVLRCFDLLLDIYSTKILEMLLIQLRSNNERERIKALLVVIHITNTGNQIVSNRSAELMTVFKHMVQHENTVKVKMVLLKTIVALAQKALIQDPEFVKFILQHCCKQTKFKLEHGTVDEHHDFIQACNKSLYILATTVGTMDDVLKSELLQYYVYFEYTDICCTIAKCLGKLFAKNCSLPDVSETCKVCLPNPEIIFVRSLILLGNPKEPKRSEHILLFLKYYSKIINKLFFPMWAEEIPKIVLAIPNEDFEERVFKFMVETIKEYDNVDFSESLANKLADQLLLYPVMVQPNMELPLLTKERGMVLKLIGVCLNHITENQTIEAKIELIVNVGRQEKLERMQNNIEIESPVSDASQALGIASIAHLGLVLHKLDTLIENEGTRKQSTNFFSNLNFIKDTQKDADIYKINLMAIETYKFIVNNVIEPKVLTEIDEKVVNYLSRQLRDAKDITIKTKSLQTILAIVQHVLKYRDLFDDFKTKSELLNQLGQIDATYENLPFYPIILKIATILLQINPNSEFQTHTFFEKLCRKFFTATQQLKSKFESTEDDERNSFIAKYLNIALPELNNLVSIIFIQNPSPSTLDDVNSVLEYWIRDRNSEVRICASHVLNNALECYIRSMKIGCESPSKFNQTGAMLGKMVPRCIDTNARVRETSINILKQILEISCVYETLTIADNDVHWVRGLEAAKKDIVTDDPKEIYRLAGEISRIIAERLSNFQHLQFSKTLLYCLNDPEQSSAIGAAIILKNFVQLKGSEMFHAVPELVKECLQAVNTCTNARARSGVLKTLLALTKHHPKLVCSEMLNQELPYQSNVIEFWQYVSTDNILTGTIIDHFLSTLSSSCLYESSDGGGSDRQNIATIQPFAIFCALREIMPGKEASAGLKLRFPELFCMLMTSLATYTNLAPPMSLTKATSNPKNGSHGGSPPSTAKPRFGFVPNKNAIKMNPCLIVLETFQQFLENLEMEQILTVLNVCPKLATSTELNNVMDLLTPMAVGVVNQLGVTSSALGHLVTTMTKYISSPYDSQRIVSVGLFSQMVPLKPSGDISSVIMLHLNSALSDPNPLVRGFCIRGMAYLGNLTDHDVGKYSEMSLSALLKGIDDFNLNCYINIPLESMKGLSRIVTALPSEKMETFQVSLVIRIRPFFENETEEIRETALLLFGDLCKVETEPTPTSEALKEQIFTNFCLFLLHLSENNVHIIRASKITLRKICSLMNAPKLNDMVQTHLLEHGQLQYDAFISDFIKVVAKELNNNIPQFIESCLPYLKSQWPEIRGNAAVIIGLLHNLYACDHQHSTESVSQKISVLLCDEKPTVRVKAANALGLMFSEALA